jgi:hypothetical protein
MCHVNLFGINNIKLFKDIYIYIRLWTSYAFLFFSIPKVCLPPQISIDSYQFVEFQLKFIESN